MTMKHEGLDVIIDFFKSQDKPERSYILLHDRQAAMIVSLWGLIPRTFTLPEVERPSTDAELWDWLWKGVSIDMDDLARRAGVNLSCAEVKFEQLRALRLIYPDGAISPWASKILAKQVLERLAQQA